jgi:DNA invertase Pin-like site-specific DNA recombinase
MADLAPRSRKRAVIYTRISDARAALSRMSVDLSKLSKAEREELMQRAIDRQMAECNEVAERLGVLVVERFKERDLSAYKPKVLRPKFERTLEMVKNGDAEIIIVWHLDRYMRRSAQLQRLIDVAERGVEIVGATSGHLDLSTPSGRMIARSLVNVSEYESEHHAERRILANTQRAEHGEWSTSNRPFGYTLDGKPKEPEATAFRKAVADVLAGKSIRGIAREWNTAGLTTTRGNKFDAQRIRDILEKPRYAALRVHQTKIVGPGTWTPLITVETYQVLQTLLTDPVRGNGRASFEQKYIGSGLYNCGVKGCGGKMQSKGGGAKYPLAYRCRGNNHLHRAAKPLDDMVIATVLEWFTRENCHKLIENAVKTTKLSIDRQALEGKQKKLGQMWKKDAISDEAFQAADHELRADIAAIDKQLLAATNTSPAATLITASQEARKAHEDVWAKVKEKWDSLSVTQRAAALDEVAVITVYPCKQGPQFDFNAVDIDPRRAAWAEAA